MQKHKMIKGSDMGVYIPNLEIPTSCFDCPVAHPALGNLGAAILGCPLIGKTLSAPFCEEKRMDNCPLAPFPPHGRLIDADALIDAIIAKYIRHERNGELVFAAAEIKQDLADIINELPTIIEAEEGE